MTGFEQPDRNVEAVTVPCTQQTTKGRISPALLKAEAWCLAALGLAAFGLESASARPAQ